MGVALFLVVLAAEEEVAAEKGAASAADATGGLATSFKIKESEALSRLAAVAGASPQYAGKQKEDGSEPGPGEGSLVRAAIVVLKEGRRFAGRGQRGDRKERQLAASYATPKFLFTNASAEPPGTRRHSLGFAAVVVGHPVT